MRFGKISLAAMAAAALITAPVAAQTGKAGSSAIAAAKAKRANIAAKRENKLGGEGVSTPIILVLAAAAVVGAVLLITANDDPATST